MSRFLRITVVLLMAAVLSLTMTAGAFAGGVKSDQRSSVTIEKTQYVLPGVARPALPAGSSGPIKGFPKWIGQYFNSGEFFFWLQLGYRFN